MGRINRLRKISYERIYNSVPVFLQNIIVSLVGWSLNRKRKSGNYAHYIRDIKSRNAFSQEEFAEFQKRELNEALSFVSKNIPFYESLYEGIDLNLNAAEDLGRLPVLEREVLKQRSSEFVQKKSVRDLVVHTTGSTGSPLRVVCDLEARQKNYAFFDSYLNDIGLDVNKPHIIIGGRVVVAPEVKKPPFWRYSRYQKSLLMSSYHLSDSFLMAYVRKITEFKPEYIESYPSSIFIIARYIVKMNLSVKVKAVITSAEMLFDEQREVIEKAFNCKVYDQYGCAEMSLFVAQCSQGKYHHRPDYGVFEIVDENGDCVPPGVVGDVVCTGLINKKMPLIRYRIGDRAVWSDTECDCGLNTRVVDKIFGRKDDVLITADGREVGRMSPVMKGLPVQESQYVQYEKGVVVVNVVPDETYKDTDKARIVKAVADRLGGETRIEIKIVSELIKGKGGKLKNVISHLKRNQVG